MYSEMAYDIRVTNLFFFQIHFHFFEACETGDLSKVLSLVDNKVLNIDAIRVSDRHTT